MQILETQSSFPPDPDADRILFWDDSAGQNAWLEVGTGLQITGTTLSATGGGGTTYWAPSWGLGIGTPCTVGVNKTLNIIVPFSGTITKWYMSAQTGPVGADLIIDINLNGTSIWNSNPSNRAKIINGNDYGSGTNFDTTTVSEGDIITIDIDQVGSSTAGQDVTVMLKVQVY